MRPSRFALAECSGLSVDLLITALLLLGSTFDPMIARLPGAITGMVTTMLLNRSNKPSATVSRFLKNTLTVLSRLMGIGLFVLLQARNPLLQPLITLAFSAMSGLALALIGYSRVCKRHTAGAD
ncbi:hypothetical protein [Agrobacterium tumefaciens]|uniref:hypothetical protein n=1 Tax=Agrobacterium tumefaciens TaxID=358 RepID=UPI0021D3445C|nr:hypothetical protein [Agrobacterium tumefaciens]UXS02911.1 hypothetical protein FY156_16260 [Agrobacterium tumefaciens]